MRMIFISKFTISVHIFFLHFLTHWEKENFDIYIYIYIHTHTHTHTIIQARVTMTLLWGDDTIKENAGNSGSNFDSLI